MMFSVRIVNSDFYLADPIANLDVCNSTFREDAAVSKVPLIRIYGATPSGQKTCLHVHGIFPYIYVPYDGTQPTDKYLKQFATSVDFAVQVALGRASSSRHHVYEITVVKGIPYYGYHEGERQFLKIVLYNPFLVTRVVSLLQNGAIMNKVFQPHEAHIPYLLQFFMDYNLYGMNLLHVSTVKFRSPVRLLDGEAGTVTSSIQRSNSPQSTSTTFAASRAQIWNEDTVSRDWVLGSDVERLSFCELEVDVLASDILNKLEIRVNVGTNPGLAAIWEDEQQRRREANESSQISAPPTQERGFIEETETEKKLKEQIREIIEERDVLIQSQMGKLGREALSPQELTSFQDSISSLAASQRDVAGDISSDANALLQLLSQKADDSATESSEVVIDEHEPVVNQSIVQEVVEASQRSFSQDLSSSLDKEMVDILTSLAEESSQPGSQKPSLSQSILLDQGDAVLDEEANDDEELSEADESIMMSQRVWDDIEPPLPETGDEQMTDVQENDIASQRVSQYDLEGMSDTWVGSFLGGDIPQLDGAADEDSDGKEDFKLPRGKRKKGNPRYQADNMSNEPDVMLSATRENSQRIPFIPEESGRNVGRGKTEKSGESISVDVWPRTVRAIRTYSKKGLSVLKSQRSSTLHEMDSTAKKDGEDMNVVNTEEEVGEGKTTEDCEDSTAEKEVTIAFDTEDEVEERKKTEDCEDEFRLFLSESSDSEDNTTKEANLGSKRNDVIGHQRNDDSLNECKAIERNSCSVRKDQGTPDECYTPVITKYFHSPGKNTEHVRKQNEEPPSSTDVLPGSCFTVDEHSPVQILPHCSKKWQGYSRKSTLRKRKLPEFVDKSERRVSKRISLRRTRHNTDLAASLHVVSNAMADVRVFIKDVSDTPTLSSKLGEAQKRLRKRRENLGENFTHVNQRPSSPARKERLPGTSSPLRLRKNEKSPLSKKRRSPNRKEERMKKYGTLPVVIAKSPKKNFIADNVAPDTLSLTEEKRLPADSLSASRQCQDEPSLHSSQAPRVFPANLNRGTGRVSSRSRTHLSGLFSSHTIATTTTDDKRETSRPVPLSSRGLSLKSANSSSRDKSQSEKGRGLSLQRKGLKRKLRLDTEKDVQSATVKVLPGLGKKRKLTLTSKEDKSRSDLGEESASETIVSSAENRLIEELKSTCEVKEEITDTQHVGFGIENNDSSSRSGNGKDFGLNIGLSDDIICIPSSPGDSDSNHESPNHAGSSASVAESTSFPVSTKTCNKSDDKSNASVSDERQQRTEQKVNSSELVSHEVYFSEEKDTELLANALFNMSYPSPLPCLEESHSPPCPSSPLDIKRDTSDLRSRHNIVQRQKFFPENSSIVEEDCKVSDDVELTRMPSSCLSQIHQSAFFSPADERLREKSLRQLIRPQLGETQSQFESTSSEYNDTNVRKQLECKSIENDDSAHSFDQIVDDKEMSCDRESFDSCVNKSNVNMKNEDRTMGESMTDRRKDSEFNSERAILEEKLHERKITNGSESHESFAGLESRNSMRTESLQQTSRTYLAEAEEQSSISTVEKEFILQLSTAEDSPSDSQLVVSGDLQTREMEISVGEENPVQGVSSEDMRDANSPVSPTMPEDHNKSQISSTHVKQSELHGNDGLGQQNFIAIEPLKRPPTSQELINSLKDYGLPQCRYQEPFCSDPDDIPACPREVGGRVLRIESKQVSNLPEFESSSSLQGLKHWRFVLPSARECNVRDLYQSIEDATNMDKNLQLKMALMGEGEVVITPCRGPPAYEAVKAWARDKLAKRGLPKQETDPALKKPELKRTTSNDGNLENVGENQGERNAELVGSNTPKIKLRQAMPVTSTPKVSPQEVTTEVKVSSVGAEVEPLVENKHQALDVVESEQKMDVMESSDSCSPVEVTSPCSLFSPNEGKTFTFASVTPQEIAPCTSVICTQAENQYLNAITGTQPMHIDEALPLSAQNDEQFSEPKDAITSSPSSVTVTPSALHSPDGTPRQCVSTTKQPLSPILQSQSPVFAVPYHSTPVATKLVYGVQSPRCTPISDATKAKRLKTNAETSGKNNVGNQASSDQTPSMRQQLLSSQFKFVTPGSEPKRLMPWSSQIEGPSPNNTYGFKVTQLNLKDAKALHEVQHLTLFSLELHVRTRRDSRPDPEFDPICAIFYYIQTDTSLASGKNKITGIICVDSESFKICSSKTENKDRSISIAETTTLLSPSSNAVASTSTSYTSVSRTAQNSSTSHLRPLLCRSGVTDHEVQYVAEEKDLFSALVRIIRKWDPDILIGYEVQMFSWGFLLERALTFEIDLCTWLSRVKGSSSASNMDAEKDQWGAAHTSEIKIAGRIILNVWRLMRHEVTLNSYSFENVAFHVLHERIPLYTFRTLSDWWDQRISQNRWRTIDHYVRRCRGNVRILESVDFIGRTSELARLFGILFFSVICRGSQYRVESMMLRIAKPMNYIAVSPSVEQRGLMRAPETIPLVMEPESRFYSDPVLVLDFQSLYPSMIIAYNYCFSTCLGRVSCLSEYGEFKFGATSLCVPPSLLKKLEGNIHVSPNGVAFVKSNVRRGILPSMLDEILQTRIMVKASMKRWKSDKSLGRMLDARQLGLKLIANVTFGYTSAHFSGRMPCVEIGDSIVRKARETLERAIDLVNNTARWGARVVYGDTDSLFVLLKGSTKEQAFNIGKDIVDTVTAMNPKPVKLKFEKVYLPCVLQTKKRYVGYMYETVDQKEPVFDAKGIETVRRDSCPAVAKVLEKSLRFLFETRDLSLIKKFVQRQCSKLMEGRASLQDFTFAKEYRGMKNYKPGACVPALELTRRMLREDRRSEPRVGERVPYVVVYGSPGLPLIQLVRRPHEVLQDPGLRLNASYYITKQILPPLNRVFSLIGLDVFTWYGELPRVVRVAQMSTDPGERKKGTISQYFSTMTCPVCQELTPADLCTNCRAKPQLSAVSLASRMRNWERTHQHLAEICYSCCGSRDTKLSCVSLDCPVFYKLVLCTRDLKSSQHFRRVLESL